MKFEKEAHNVVLTPERFSDGKIERVKDTPYIHIEKHPEQMEKYYALWGIKVASLMEKFRQQENRFEDIFHEQVKFVQCILEGTPDQAIELRYVVYPNPVNWTMGEMDILLIGRNTGSSRKEAEEQALQMWDNMRPVLAVESGQAEFAAISEYEGFISAHLPFNIRDIVEITRREEMFPLGKNEAIYLPCPFIPNIGAMGRLCKGLLAHKDPVILSVILKTAAITDDERGYLNSPVATGGSPLGFLSSGEKDTASTSRMRDNSYHSMVKPAYLMKIQVAGSGRIPAFILDLIGSEITVASHGHGVNINGNNDGAYRGGYAWHRPAADKEFRVALNNIIYREFENWAPTIAPKGMERLRYIFSPIEACAAFRLPVALDSEQVMGLPVRNNLPLVSTAIPENGILLGVNRFAGAKMEVRLDDETRRRHCYIQGATGTGKTTLILNMMLQDIHAGKGAIIIDYHGDMSIDLLKRLPKERASDVIYFNPADLEYPIGFNPLSYDAKSPYREIQKEKIIGGILSWLHKEYTRDSMGPFFYQNVRNALLLVMADDSEPATLVDFVEIFHDKALREKKLSKLKNPMVKKFWQEYGNERYKKVGDDGYSMLQYILCKFSPFVDSEIIRNIIGQARSKMDFREIMDSGKILVCNLSKGLIGDFNARFLGLMLLSKIEQAALSRADIPEEERRDCFIYIDECQNFQTEYFYNLLSEMRKYRLNITLANQHFSQLDDRMMDSIIGNCATKVIFKTGVRDAVMLEPALYPYDRRLIVKLPDYQAAVKMPVNGDTKIFTLGTLPLTVKPHHGTMELAIAMSRLGYGKMNIGDDRQIVDLNQELGALEELSLISEKTS